MIEFLGAARPLDPADIEGLAHEFAVEPEVVRAVLAVETGGKGFLADGRPQILFEAHLFGKFTRHAWDAAHPGISSKAWDRSLYGKGGAHQYQRLAEACALDREAALKATSWGLGQVLGVNCRACGYKTVEEFVAAMCDSEREQLRAMLRFCETNGLLRHLRDRDWESFARGYNGPAYAQNRYAERLAFAYAQNHAGSC